MNNTLEKRSTVLIADDNQEILDLIADDLSENYEVIKVTNGQEAINCLQENRVDLILSDVMMPYVDGYELCARIKDSVNHCHIPVVLLTAKINLHYKIQGLNHGADAYIEKPFSLSYLQAQISSLLRNRHHVREHYSKSPETPLQSIAFNKADQAFLQKLNSLIMDNLSQEGLCVDMLAEHMHMSRPTLYRKIKAISNLSPNELINITRLKRATELLIDREFKIYEISALVGFNSSSHFTRNFQKQFGISPKEYADSIQTKTL